MPVFEQTERQLGWTVGANLLIEHRLAGGNAESISRHGAELVALAPDVICYFATFRCNPTSCRLSGGKAESRRPSARAHL
jgi:hypothetical protein